MFRCVFFIFFVFGGVKKRGKRRDLLPLPLYSDCGFGDGDGQLKQFSTKDKDDSQFCTDVLCVFL